MRADSVDVAIREAERFLRTARGAKQTVRSINLTDYIEAGAGAAACRRASLDLTRALAEMRRRDG
jgi:hypothetical protein